MKKKVEMGKEHITKSGSVIAAKVFRGQLVCCKNNCAVKIDIVRQQEIFSNYYNSLEWNTKTMFIRSCVSRNECAQANSSNPIVSSHTKKYTYNYAFLSDSGETINVCKEFFQKCLQVTSNRVYRALDSTTVNPSAKDQRGRRPSPKKTRQADMNVLIEYIKRFPRYKSHYGRASSDREYLSPHLNIIKMYREYKIICDSRNIPILSEYIFREAFNKKFNLSFKTPKIDTCKTCDVIQTKLSADDLTYEEREIELANKGKHDEDVTQTKLNFLDDINMARDSNGEIQCITFDLEKTLETPSLSTSAAYYSRKLWTYNLCVYDEVEKKAHMYIWSENVASRGAQEIASCLKFHITNNLPEETKHIILYSDGCAGQNRNIKMVLMLKKIMLQSQHLKGITQKFFVSGHSYNSCDRCFSLIEKQKRVTSQIFTVNHWIQLISRAKKTEPLFYVKQMESDLFFSTQNLEKLIMNRKKNSHGEKINWHTIREIGNKRNELFSIYIRQAYHNYIEKINLQKKNVTEEQFIQAELHRLNIGYNPITISKYNDLQNLLKYIPSRHHDFYKNLRVESNNFDDDYNLASDSEPESQESHSD